MIGKKIRLAKILKGGHRTIIVAVDHGLTSGPIAGINQLRNLLPVLAAGKPDALLLHRGAVLAGHWDPAWTCGMIIHLSGSTSLSPDPDAKGIFGTVEEAVKIGADAVSVHVNLGSATEAEMLRDLGIISSQCREWGMPLLAMMYLRGPKVRDSFDAKGIAHAARVAAEMGADIVKVNYSGSPDSFREVLEGCFVPVVIAGGEKMTDERGVLSTVKEAMDSGAAGVSFGRNVFQHPNPASMLKAINHIIHGNGTVDGALQWLAKEKVLRRSLK
ncbi:MAG: class I fructose-bisphosphate aldolase family protein [Deltaproteobacteria bacterium]|nr:class I fructose-bisphosphate aldolase family protein [Deltaproteobacteria bacterium]